MAKLLVGIIFGGRSKEHEVSLQSAKNIVDKIDKNRFDVILLGIDKQGQWYISDDMKNDDLLNTDDSSIHTIFNAFKAVITSSNNRKKGQLINAKNIQELTKIDVIFPIVHGKLGEDGSLQGMLRMIDIPFVGSDVLGSAICIDKDITKRLLRDAGLKVAPFVTVTNNRRTYSFADLSSSLGVPFFVKPASQGSSIGISKVSNEKEFINAMNLAFKFDYKVILEKNIKGREIECAILGNSTPKVSVCGEVVVTGNDFYSYKRKYFCNDDVQIIIPASLSQEANNRINEAVITAYQTLECCGMARIDFFLTSKNEVIINEINTLPGFTHSSMYPKLWQASGLSYTELISNLIELAIERHAINDIDRSL